ncbi:MAG: hypothetical protein QNJ60_07940 [Xenococcaceae cyanobacterium MO_188.B19]|nr:hypothetical protein [Xenococcaceae cyanobacterium MO_188.B19]
MRLSLENYLQRRAKAKTSHREKLEAKMSKAKKKGQGNRWSKKLTVARLAEQKAQQLFQDIAILLDWLKNDILALAGPDYHSRNELSVLKQSKKKKILEKSTLLFDLYDETDDILVRSAICYLLKNGSKLPKSDKPENSKKFAQRRRKVAIKIERLKE